MTMIDSHGTIYFYTSDAICILMPHSSSFFLFSFSFYFYFYGGGGGGGGGGGVYLLSVMLS